MFIINYYIHKMKSLSLANHTLTNHIKKIGKSKCNAMLAVSKCNMMVSKRTFASINKDVRDNIKQQMDQSILRASLQEKECDGAHHVPQPCEIQEDYSIYAMPEF